MEDLEVLEFKIRWDFSDTEFEEIPYKIAIQEIGLPEYVSVEEDEAENIKEYLMESLEEEWGFPVKRLTSIND